MTRTSSFIFLSLSIWLLHFTYATAQGAPKDLAVKDLDPQKLLNKRWYGIIGADTFDSGDYACELYKFSHMCPQCQDNRLTVQYMLNSPDSAGDIYGWNYAIKPPKGNPQGLWSYPTLYRTSNFVFLDHGKNYDWVAWADYGKDGYNYLNVVSTTPENKAARTRGLELAKKLGLNVHDMAQDAKKCDYKGLELRLSGSY